MNFGLVGWATATGNGGMNSDIADLASWITHWLVPEHPKLPIHQQYFDKKSNTKIIQCRLQGDNDIYKHFLKQIDGIIYVEHPYLVGEFNIVIEAKRLNKIVVGIPMWEWWPEHKDWALKTDILWSVTRFTNRYLSSLSDVLYVHGWQHNWRNRVYGNHWGVNLDEFPYIQRTSAKRFVFVNGNGGYKLRKASDIIYKAFTLPDAPPLTVYTQQEEILEISKSNNITIVSKNFPERRNVYEDGDVFLFPSYWEGLCHGLYESQAMGGIVITSDHPPMNECGTPYRVKIENISQENIAGKNIIKAIPNFNHLYELAKSLYKSDIYSLSKESRKNIEFKYSLKDTLLLLYDSIIFDINNCDFLVKSS